MTAKHPSTRVRSSGGVIWAGTEIEGRYSGLPAIFLTRVPSRDDQLKLAAWLNEHTGESHVVFLTETFSGWVWLSNCFRERPHMLRHITAGVTPAKLDAFLVARKHVLAPEREDGRRVKVSAIVRLFGRDALLAAKIIPKLSAEDQVSFGMPYNLVTVPAHSCMVTVPAQYKKDRPL